MRSRQCPHPGRGEARSPGRRVPGEAPSTPSSGRLSVALSSPLGSEMAVALLRWDSGVRVSASPLSGGASAGQGPNP